MPKAGDLLRQGRSEELWQMCCGFLRFNIADFMAVQKRLLEQQLTLLNASPLGEKIMRGARPKTLEEFRRSVPLTTYRDYCPELMEKREDVLPARPEQWVRTSGRSGEYPCRWVPMTEEYAREMSVLMYGIGMLSGCRGWGDSSQIPERPSIIYTVAPRPYMSGAMASLLEKQTPISHLPALEVAEGLSFEERVRLGFRQALSQGIDYFFGLSMVLAQIGDKFGQSSGKINAGLLFSPPKALFRLVKGLARSKLARRPMLPRDIWPVKGIICSGLDSWVYRDKIKEFWGRYPLDVYATTEGGIIATQVWDYDSMTFIPNLNFLEFVPEEEHFKWQLDRSYQPETVLLNEVEEGMYYEIIITNFHGGSLVRYRIGDLIKITSLRNEKLGINIPQMVFARRADGLINFVVVQLTEKLIWQAIESTHIAYEDWAAYKKPGESVLTVLLEPQNTFQSSAEDWATRIRQYILRSDESNNRMSGVLEDLTDMVDFNVEVELLPQGAFANFTKQKQSEGADMAHLKPPHLNPSEKVLSLLRGEEETIIVTKVSTRTRTASGEKNAEKAQKP